jgi:hypothetical protein
MIRLALSLVLAVCIGCSDKGSDGKGPCPDKGGALADCSKGGCIGSSWTSSPPKGYGESCKVKGDCQSGLCAFDEESKLSYCTQLCDPSGGTPCPREAECFSSESGTSVCGPPVAPADGC